MEIRISPLSEERCQEIIQKCGKRVENLEKLLAGDFPEELKDLFTQRDGLFPLTVHRIPAVVGCPAVCAEEFTSQEVGVVADALTARYVLAALLEGFVEKH